MLLDFVLTFLFIANVKNDKLYIVVETWYFQDSLINRKFCIYYRTAIIKKYKSSVAKCIDEINSWMCQNFLQLNKEITEVIVFGNKYEVIKVNAYSRCQTTKKT